MPKKTFVLDTNVLLHSAQSIESFKDNDVVLPMAVIEELDKFKKYQDELGRNARQVIRTLDVLRENGHLGEGVSLSFGSPVASGNLTIVSAYEANGKFSDEMKKIFDSVLSMESADNRILRVALYLHRKIENVVFISKDINLRLKADALGIKVMDYEREKIDFDRLFEGFQTAVVPHSLISEIYQQKRLAGDSFPMCPNEFVILQADDNPKKTAIARKKGKELVLLDAKSEPKIFNVTPRNKEQRMALDLLLDPKVQLVTLVGQAGTGKTLLALAAALELVLHQKAYEKILVSRPIVPLGNDIGFLPGDKDEKLSSWMQPIFDNLDYLMHSRNLEQVSSKKTDDLIGNHKIELEAITYIRGRSLPRQFVIVDEAQNLTPHEVKTIISRAGENTKMVLTGDPNQIDNPYLDASSNGLTYTVERMKKQALHGHMSLLKSERSELAALAAELL
ncbi:MAG: PhoH family protein [Lentisphaerae bacterium]|nr:PhoH family protein [Lentisphaerota bacterium]MCP4101509.1 PhoH family protein [Lentisphaerota bacterium]